MTRRRWLIALALFAVALVGWRVLLARSGDALEIELGEVEVRDVFRSYVSASGEIVAERYAEIGSSVMGRVVELPVIEGDEVARGDLLARVDPVQARSDLQAAEAAIGALGSEAQSAEDQLQAARAELRAAEARFREATTAFERASALFADELVAESELDVARARAETSEAEVEAARAAVARAGGGRDAARSRVTQARAQAARARDVVEKTSIVSPIDGVVSSLQVREGEMVVIGIQNQPGTTLMTISDLRELNAEVQVAEADVLRVAVGQPAEVTLEAIPERVFAGRVTEVGASALPQLDAGAAAREFRVEVRLEDAAAGMRPGLTCDAEILVAEERDVTVVPLQSVVIRAREASADVGDAEDGQERRGVFVVDDGVARFRQVVTGIIGGLDIAVSGIDAGTPVVTGPYQVLRELADGDRVRVR